MEYLFLMLGTGPDREKPADVLDRNYRRTRYFLGGEPDGTVCETPFIGEALLRLQPGRFGEIHLFGTADSMWHTLYRHLVGGDALREDQEAFYWELAEHIQGRTLHPDAVDWARLQQALGEALGVPVTGHLLPLPTSDDNVWAILEAMTSTGLKRGRLSIDVTHGLRSHPIFSLVTLFYLRSLNPELTVGSVFYGAYELRREYQDEGGEKAPIFDLKPVIDLLDWTESANAFARYGDASLVAAHLRAAGGGAYEKLAGQGELFSRVLQLNTLGKLKDNAGKFLKELDRMEGTLPPLRLLRARLGDFPRLVLGRDKTWQVYLSVARHHWEHYQAGLAVLAAWEAVVARLAEAYGLTSTSDRETYKTLGDIALCRGKWRYKTYPDVLKKLNHRARQLYKFRNGIAHADQDTGSRSFQPIHVYTAFPSLLAYLEKTLPDAWLDQMPSYCAWPASSSR